MLSLPLKLFVLMATVSAVLGYSKQRNPVIWFLIGFFLPFIGLFIALLIPSKNPDDFDFENSTTRQLRNQLAKERGRRKVAEQLLREGKVPNFAHASATPQTYYQNNKAVKTLVQWHVHIGNEESRLLTVEEIAELYQTGALQATSLVWRKGMEEWQPLQSTDLQKLL